MINHTTNDPLSDEALAGMFAPMMIIGVVVFLFTYCGSIFAYLTVRFILGNLP